MGGNASAVLVLDVEVLVVWVLMGAAAVRPTGAVATVVAAIAVVVTGELGLWQLGTLFS